MGVGNPGSSTDSAGTSKRLRDTATTMMTIAILCRDRETGTVDFSGSKHPITRGLDKLRLVDESYWNLVGNSGSIDLIATGVEDGQPRPLLWTRQAGKGRVFVSIPGHFTWTFDDPLFRLILLRGMAWTAGESVDRFNELTTLGARISE